MARPGPSRFPFEPSAQVTHRRVQSGAWLDLGRQRTHRQPCRLVLTEARRGEDGTLALLPERAWLKLRRGLRRVRCSMRINPLVGPRLHLPRPMRAALGPLRKVVLIATPWLLEIVDERRWWGIVAASARQPPKATLIKSAASG